MPARTRLLVVVLGWLLVACSPAPVESTVLRIGFSPAAQPLQAAVSACLPSQAGLGANLQLVYPNQADLTEWDLYFQLGEPAQMPGFAAPIAWEDVLLVLPASNRLQLDASQVAAVFRGQIEDWSELGEPQAAVQLYLPPAADEARSMLERQVIQGRLAGLAHIVADPPAMLAALQQDQAGIGVLPAAWAHTANLTLLDLGLRLPVLALADQPPQGATRALLACLQGPTGQAALQQSYTGLQE